MKTRWACALIGALALAPGCTAQLETTDNSVRFDAEVPKIERGEQPLDMDKATDDDLDIDTPAPGDR